MKAHQIELSRIRSDLKALEETFASWLRDNQAAYPCLEINDCFHEEVILGWSTTKGYGNRYLGSCRYCGQAYNKGGGCGCKKG